jgi:hypothetical protein
MKKKYPQKQKIVLGNKIVHPIELFSKPSLTFLKKIGG